MRSPSFGGRTPSGSWRRSVDDQRVEDVFATVPREDFLGPGPWPILRRRGYVTTPDDDPTYLYSDVLVGIVPERGLNNGMPSYHAPLMSKASVGDSDHVVHVGAGTGYYTAILARLADKSGRVTAIEFDPELTAANLATMAKVDVIEGTAPSFRSILPT